MYVWRNREFGFHLSLILFLVQIPQFALGGVYFQLISGISITPMLYFTPSGMGGGFAPLMGPGGEILIGSAYNPDLVFIGINIYAVVIAYLVAARLVGQIKQGVFAQPELNM